MFQFGEFVRFVSRKVVLFAEIVGEVEEHVPRGDVFRSRPFGAFGGVDKLPIAQAHSVIVVSCARTPEQRLVRRVLPLAGQKGNQIHAVDVRHVGAGQGERSGAEVEGHHRLVIHRAGLDDARPLEELRHADAAFESLALGTAQRGVAGTVDRVASGGSAVVVVEDDEGSFQFAGFFQLVHHPADGVIHGAEHRGVDPAPFVLDLLESLQVLFRRLQRRMHCIESEVEEERFRCIALAFHESRGLFPERIGEIALFVHRLAVVVDGRVIASSALWIRQVEMPAAEESEEFIKAALQRRVPFATAEVPLADHARGVSRRAQTIRQRRDSQRQRAGDTIQVIIAGSLLVTAAHQGRSCRRAERAVGIRGSKPHATRSDQIDVRRGDVFTAMRSDVGIAHVVGKDEDDVGLFREGREDKRMENQE